MERSINNETRLAKMEQKIDNIVEDVKEISKDIKDHARREEERYEKLDSKYSGKWVEKFTIAVAGGLVIAVLTFLLK